VLKFISLWVLVIVKLFLNIFSLQQQAVATKSTKLLLSARQIELS